MNRLRPFAALLVLAAALAACSSSPHKIAQVEPAPIPEPTSEPAPAVKAEPAPVPPMVPVPAPVVDSSAVELDNALKYFQDLRKMSAASLRREHDSAKQAFAREPSDLNRVRFALACSLPAASIKDERRALELLEPLTKNSRSPQTPLRGFAVVLHAFVAEQTKSASNAQELKDKLEALMSVEKSLSERATPGVNK